MVNLDLLCFRIKRFSCICVRDLKYVYKRRFHEINCQGKNMKIFPIPVYILMWCQAAETLDQLTDLGHNVTINCDLDDEDVYWVLQKQSDYSTVILRSFSNPTTAFYFNETFENKYSVQSKHRLVIYNVTVDELGVYYCMNTDTPPKLSHSTRLNIIGKNDTVPVQNPIQWSTYFFISGLLNGILIIAVIGLLKVYVVKNGCWKRSENHSGFHNTDHQTQVTEQPQDPNQLQYVAVDFSKLCRNIRSSQDNSTYASLKLPKS